MQSLRAAQAAAAPEPPVETLHPISFRRFAHTHPIDFYAAIRPDTQTTNQTLRMMGVYDSDYFFVKKMGVHIPHASGLRKFHPDVSLAASKRFM